MINKYYFVALFLLFFTNNILADSKKNQLSDTSFFFPLSVGSYWMYKDSLYSPEYSEDVGTTIISKDSVIKTDVSDTGIVYTLSSITIDNGRRENAGLIQYIYSVNKLVKVRVEEKNGKWSLWEPFCKLEPADQDTIFTSFDTLFYCKKQLKITEVEVFCLRSINCGHEFPTGRRYFFAKGVGLIGSDFCTDGITTNLIEYRIGNGPVVKKHWLMENTLEKTKKH